MHATILLISAYLDTSRQSKLQRQRNKYGNMYFRENFIVDEIIVK